MRGGERRRCIAALDLDDRELLVILRRSGLQLDGPAGRPFGLVEAVESREINSEPVVPVEDSVTEMEPDQSGNFSARSIAWKRGSLRRGSSSGLVLSPSRPGVRSRAAVSSHSRACLLSPHCA